jgi:hypothetical protein
MPEILVENEPWLGLVVLADTNIKMESPGYYALARADEWHNVYENVTLWRGPEKREEIVPRRQLIEMECQTVHVDEHGFYTCPPIVDDLKDYVEKAAEEVLGEMADERAAETLSYVDDETSSDFDDEVWIKAEVGDAVAVNGDLIWSKKDRKPPRGYADTERGGWAGSEEEEIPLDSLVDPIASQLTKELKRPIYPEVVEELLREIYLKGSTKQDAYIYWSSSSGSSEVWASKRAIKKAESKEERDAREKEERYQRMIKQDRQRIEAERKREAEYRRERIKRGGFPGPKDWSPRGRIPGEA